MKLLVPTVISLLGASASAAPNVHATARAISASYEGVKVVRVPTGSSTSVDALNKLISSLHLSLWSDTPVANSHVDLEVPADKYASFVDSARAILAADGSSYDIHVMHEDLASSILAESAGMFDFAPSRSHVAGFAATTGSGQSFVNDSYFDSYHTYDDHLTFLGDLVEAFPNNAKLVTVDGATVEGRNITGINIFGSNCSPRPAVIWFGTVHAREWVTTMVTEYLAYQLLGGYSNATDVKTYVDSHDIYIFPISNPDGFVYTQTTDRMWRKNRQTPPSGFEGNVDCTGRDMNRNWDVAWNQTNGASDDPCAQDFKGLAPGDAPETAALQAFVKGRVASSGGAKMLVDWHSYSQLFMTPYGYSCAKIATDSDELVGLAAGFADAVRPVHGMNYTTGPICTTIYPTTGSSTDFAFDNGVKYSFAAELRDQGDFGFVLPPEQIKPTGEEIWAGVKYLFANMKSAELAPCPTVTDSTPSPSQGAGRLRLDASVAFAAAGLLAAALR